MAQYVSQESRAQDAVDAGIDGKRLTAAVF